MVFGCEDIAFAELVGGGVGKRCCRVYDVGEGDAGVGDGLADVLQGLGAAVGYAEVEGGGPGVEVLHAAEADAVLELRAFFDAVVKEADEVPVGVFYAAEHEAVNLASKSSGTVYCEIFHVSRGGQFVPSKAGMVAALALLMSLRAKTFLKVMAMTLRSVARVR